MREQHDRVPGHHLPEADGHPKDGRRYSEVPIRRPERRPVVQPNDLPATISQVRHSRASRIRRATGGHAGYRPGARRSGTAVVGSLSRSRSGLGAPASNAISVPITPTLTDTPNVSDSGTHVVGSPQLTIDYSGVGTSRHVYAQIVDKNTGQVVGNIVTRFGHPRWPDHDGRHRHGEHRVDVHRRDGTSIHRTTQAISNCRSSAPPRHTRTSPRTGTSTSRTSGDVSDRGRRPRRGGELVTELPRCLPDEPRRH